MKRLDVDLVPIHCEWDNTFPNHPPDPTRQKNMTDLSVAVVENGCELGIGMDGDGDRIGVVDEQGRFIHPDRLMALIAADVFPEINTSGMRREETEPYPSWPILKRYHELGGLYVSLGSDAHQSRDIGQGFDETAKKLKTMGFIGEIVFEYGSRRVINWQ